MTLAFVVPGLDEAASEKAIAILQNRLSQEQEAALVLKHAHWNVTGPNFIAVHEMLDPEVEVSAPLRRERFLMRLRVTCNCRPSTSSTVDAAAVEADAGASRA